MPEIKNLSDKQKEILAKSTVKLGLEFSELGNNQAAIKFFSEAAELAPNDSSIFVLRANCYQHLERYSDAVIDCRRALEIDPKNSQAYDILASSFFCIHGPDLHSDKPIDRTQIDEITQTVSSMAQQVTLRKKDVETYTTLGLENVPNSKLAVAFRLCSHALELNHKNADAYGTLGSIAYSRGNYPLSLEYSKQAVKYDKNNPNMHNVLGSAQFKNNMFNESRQSFLHALKLDPKHVASLCNLGVWHREYSRNFKRAAMYYDTAVKLDPSLIPALIGIRKTLEQSTMESEPVTSSIHVTEPIEKADNLSSFSSMGFKTVSAPSNDVSEKPAPTKINLNTESLSSQLQEPKTKSEYSDSKSQVLLSNSKESDSKSMLSHYDDIIPLNEQPSKFKGNVFTRIPDNKANEKELKPKK